MPLPPHQLLPPRRITIPFSYRHTWPPVTNRLIILTPMNISRCCLVQAPVGRPLHRLLPLARLRGHHNRVNLRELLCTITASFHLRILRVLKVLGQHLDLLLRRAPGLLPHRQHPRSQCRHHLSRPISHQHRMLYPIVLNHISPLLLRCRCQPPPAIRARPPFRVEHPLKAHTIHRQQQLLRRVLPALLRVEHLLKAHTMHQQRLLLQRMLPALLLLPSRHLYCSLLLLQLN